SNKLRQLIGQQRITTGDRSLAVTISVGLAEVQEEKSMGSLLRRADEALYAAKGMGRNRVYYHDGTQPVLHGAPEVVKDA
ncbi:MAG: diguanylate cyclase, partial [Candidatus Paceibacterota bacterium]